MRRRVAGVRILAAAAATHASLLSLEASSYTYTV